MTGNDAINVTLSIEQWREVYRILNNDGPWKSHLRKIEERCRNNETTIPFPLAMTWPMSATLRLTAPDLAEEISRQMNAQVQTVWWDSAEDTAERFPMDIVPIESVLVALSDSPSPIRLDKRHSRSAKSSG